MATNTEKIVVQVVVQGEKDLQRLEKRTGSTTKGFGKMAAGILTASAAFQQITKAVGNAIKTFTKFEFEMAKVKAITGATEKDFKKLSNTAQQLGRSTFFTASQVAELQVNFGKLGFSTTEILNAQEATLQLATATQSDLGRAAIVAGAAVRGFGLNALETQRVVDVMAVAFTSSALDIEKFQTSMTKVAPIAAAAAISIEATTAVMGTLTDAGIEASIAGTSLRNIFLKMQDPASDLSQHLGFTVESTEDLEKALLQLNSEGLSNAEMMQLVDLRQVAAFQTMVNGADRVIDLKDALKDASGEAQNMADIIGDTLQGDILRAKSAWEGFEISILGGNNNISRSIRLVLNDFTKFLGTIVDNMRTPEMLGSDFLKDALNNVKDITVEMDKMVGTPETNVNIKTRGELLLDEIEKMERVMEIQKQSLEIAKKEGEGTGPRAIAARKIVTDLEKQIEAREIALADLNQILDDEIKAEQNKNDKIQLEKDIAAERERRRKEQENKSIKETTKLKRTEFDLDREINDFKLGLMMEGSLNEIQMANLRRKLIQQEIDDLKRLLSQLVYTAEQREIMMTQLFNLEKQLNADSAKDKDKRLEEDIVRAALSGQNAMEAVKSVIRAHIMEAVAAQIKQIMSSVPFPANLVVGAGAGLLVAGLVDKAMAVIPDKFANGGMVHGRSHAQGGEKFAVGGRVVELEGGEAVINKRSTAMFRNQLSAMNSAGGGVKFADGGLLNMPSFTQQQFNALGQNQMMGAMGGQNKVVVVEADITNSQNAVNVIQSDARI